MVGASVGKAKSVNQDITKQTEYMQDLIDVAYTERDDMKFLLIQAEEKAESWERRYYNLLSAIDEEAEDED